MRQLLRKEMSCLRKGWGKASRASLVWRRTFCSVNSTENIGEPSVEVETNDDFFGVKIKMNSGDSIAIKSGHLARIADGCAVATFKGTSVMATVVSKRNDKEYGSFVPLSVSYKQKAAALGRIPLNFFRREIGQTEYEILTSRVIDRSLRPLFPKFFSWDTQVICSPLAIDGTNFPDVLAINAASAALALSDIPWNGPVGAVRVGLVEGKAVINPSKHTLLKSDLNLLVATQNSKSVLMLDGFASNVNENDLVTCIKTGTGECAKIAEGIQSLRKAAGKEKRQFEIPSLNEDLRAAIEKIAEPELREIFQNFSHDKMSRDEAVKNVFQKVQNDLEKVWDAESLKQVNFIFYSICKKTFRSLILETEIRCDGRTARTLRDMKCEVDLYAPLHGSSMFRRGQTQVLCTVALDSPNSALRADKITALTSGLKEKNFFVHYEFPPFAVNETKAPTAAGRREIGHGVLAERALQANVPADFPFTIRLSSEVLESNGSSSMATVCGGTLALLDAGVALKNPCAGVAMGLVSECDSNPSNYQILSDISGIEDHFGDMDFKIAGTKKGFTALQLDTKIDGISMKIVGEALLEAKDALGEILQHMNAICSGVRTNKKSNWPRIEKVTIPPQIRSKFLGTGWINVKKLEATTGVEVMEDTFGEFEIFAANEEALKEATDIIENIIKENEEPTLEFGGVYKAIISEVKDHGCMVKLYPSMKPVLLPVSQLDVRKVNHPSVLGLEPGQEILVKYFGRDPVSGNMRLSRKVLLGPPSEVVQKLIKKEKDDGVSVNELSK